MAHKLKSGSTAFRFMMNMASLDFGVQAQNINKH